MKKSQEEIAITAYYPDESGFSIGDILFLHLIYSRYLENDPIDFFSKKGFAIQFR